MRSWLLIALLCLLATSARADNPPVAAPSNNFVSKNALIFLQGNGNYSNLNVIKFMDGALDNATSASGTQSGSVVRQANGTYTLGSGIGSVIFSSFTSASTSNTLDNTSFAQEWDWSAIGNNTGLFINGTSSGSGTAFSASLTGSGNTGNAGLFTNPSTSGYAGYFNGAVNITGNLTSSSATINNLNVTGTCTGCGGGGGGGSALSGLTAATATNSISNGGFAQSWLWPTLANNTALTIQGTTTGSGTSLAATLTGSGNTGIAGSFTNPSATGLALSVNGRASFNPPLPPSSGGTGLSSPTIVYPETYGALGNGNTYFDGAFTTPSTLTSSTANFSSSNVGNPICVAKVGTSSTQMCGTISAVNSSTSVTVSFTGTTSGTSLQFAFGTDDTTAFQTMLSTAPCSTRGCTIKLQTKHYILTASFTFPANIPTNLFGSGPGVPNTVQNYLPGFPLANKNNGSQLQWLTKSLTHPAICVCGTLGITNSATQDYIRDVALYGGVGIAMDGGGADGLDFLNWQGGFADNVYVFNFTGWGTYTDGLQAPSFTDYIEAIDMNHYYLSFNGLGGLKVGSAAIPVKDLETISCEQCIIEGNGGPAILLAGIGIQGFSLLRSVIQWNNVKSANPEIVTSGLVIGGLIASNYTEVDTNFGSQSTSTYGNRTGMLGITYLANFQYFPSTYTPLVFSASGTVLPTCDNFGASVTYQTTATVSDSTGCTLGSTYVSGGSTRCNVQCNGTNWIETGAASF